MSDLERYSRQMRLEKFGEAAQRRLRSSSVVLAGCGALGSVSSSLLVRAGVGRLRIIDRDFVELNNLQRQMLFDEDDVRTGTPKAEAARRKLAAVNSEVEIESCVDDLTPKNASELLSGFDLIIDATDNFETRYLLNDFAVKTGVPWIYAAVVASEGRTMTIVPGETPCLRCIFPDPPRAGETPTCETAGVLGSAVAVTASLQATEALKLLGLGKGVVGRGMVVIDVWQGSLRRTFAEPRARNADCPTCAARRFDYLEGALVSTGVKLCGRNAVHVSPPGDQAIDLNALSSRLGAGKVLLASDFFLRFDADGKEVTVFRDGRAIVKGTSDPFVARAVYARYIGS